MRALSVKQPWAELIARGEKTIELRTWRTNYRGPLAIVASCLRSPAHPHIDGARGAIVAVTELVDVRLTVSADSQRAHCKASPEEFAWVLRATKRIDPIPYKGGLSIRWMPPELVAHLTRLAQE